MAPSRGVQYIVAAVLLVIAYIYAIHFAVSIKDAKTGWKARLNDTHEAFLVSDPTLGPVLTSGRGGQYFIGATTPEKKRALDSCILTFWGLTHFMFYAIVGFLCPNLFWEMFALGAAFELYEYQKFGCHDLLDIAWNSLGFGAGSYIRRRVDPPRRLNKMTAL